jgi:glutamate synthase domain-containing protein 3
MVGEELQCVVSIINTTTEVSVYIRAVNIERDGERYGTYYQAVRSYREQGKVKQEVIHLGQHSTSDKALTAWEREIEELVRTRPKQVRKLQAKLERLRELTGVEQVKWAG